MSFEPETHWLLVPFNQHKLMTKSHTMNANHYYHPWHLLNWNHGNTTLLNQSARLRSAACLMVILHPIDGVACSKLARRKSFPLSAALVPRAETEQRHHRSVGRVHQRKVCKTFAFIKKFFAHEALQTSWSISYSPRGFSRKCAIFWREWMLRLRRGHGWWVERDDN